MTAKNTEPIYTGYAGILWSAVFAALTQYYSLVLEYTSPPSGQSTTGSQVSAAAMFVASQAMFSTLSNACRAINAYMILRAWNSILLNLEAIQVLPLSPSGQDAAFFNARVAAYSSAITALTPLVPQPPYGPPSNIANGQVVIPEVGLITFFQNFNYESPPIGLNAANLPSNAAACATAMRDVATALFAFQGNMVNGLYDSAVLQANCAAYVSAIISSLTSSFTDPVALTDAWNQAVAFPAMALAADEINNAPYTSEIQQQQIVKYSMISLMGQIANFMLSLRNALASQLNVTQVLVGETLMDVAARTLGDFTLWQDIAQINGLSPPYTAPTSSPGVAGWGDQLILPTPGAAISPQGSPPSYANNFLGTDLFLGPINGPMPVWTGDFQTVTGYKNLSYALGRRLQTPIGSLIYHALYGSQIPKQIGEVEITESAQHIALYGKSAILSDPRIARVISATASGTVNEIAFSAVVTPGGFQTTAVQVNEVILPTP